MLLLLSLLACDDTGASRDAFPDLASCQPAAAPMPLGSAEAFLDLWFRELIMELVDHITLQLTLASLAEGAIREAVEAGVEPCPTLHYTDNGYVVDAGEGCSSPRGSAWAGRVEVVRTEGVGVTTYEDFAYAAPAEDGGFDVRWDGEFVYEDGGDVTLDVEGRRASPHVDDDPRSVGVGGHFVISQSGSLNREFMELTLDDNPRDPSMIGGLCVSGAGNGRSALRFEVRGEEALQFVWRERCATGSFDGERFADLCI